jgi:Secretion system C-terminal sorting domain/Prolyl oligopeptidase family
MKKYHSIRCTIAVLFLVTIFSLNGYNQVDVTKKFLFKYHPSAGMSIPYRLFVPDNYDTLKTYPAVLTLHGLGECGTDNKIQIEKNYIATCWADSSFQKRHPAFIVSPQCPVGSDWTTPGVKSCLFEIADSLLSVYKIDTNRIYITGLSLGGNGTWDYLATYPDFFAAAIPVCGWYDSSAVKYFSHVPVWNNHGGGDGTVPVINSRNLIRAYENLNLPVVYTHCNGFVCNTISQDKQYRLIADNVDYIYSEYKNLGHNAWDSAYTDTTILEWLFSKHKRTRDIITLTDPIEYKHIAGNYVFRFSSPVDSGRLSMLFSNDLGYTWEPVKENTGSIDSLEVNTELLPDSPFGLFKVQLMDSSGNTFGAGYSYYYNINNAVNGIPFLRYNTANRISPVSADSIPLLFLTGDAEEGPLDLTVYYKNDDSASYSEVHTFVMESSIQYQERYIKMNDLAYGKKARLKFELTDHVYQVFDSTDYFTNNHNKPSAIPDLATEDEVWIFPNPVRDEICIHTTTPLSEDESMNVTLFDLSGRMVFAENKHIRFGNTVTVKITNTLKSGIYLLELRFSNTVINKKVIIE